MVAAEATEVDWKTVFAGASALIALASLGAVLFKEFLQGARLTAQVDRVSLLRVPVTSRQHVTAEVLIDEVLSDPRSDQASQILRSVPRLQDAVKTRDRRQVAAALEAHGRANQITYDPPPPLVARYFQAKEYGTNFYVPLVLSNTGRKTAHLSGLVLVFRDKADHARKWAFVPYVTLDPKKLLDRQGEVKDVDRISGLFVGTSVPPQSSIEVHPWFIMLPDAENKIISRTGMVPAKYELQVCGYGANSKEAFRTRWVEYVLTEDLLQQAFLGSDAINGLTVESHAIAAVGRRG